jgi:hypothetical protein
MTHCRYKKCDQPFEERTDKQDYCCLAHLYAATARRPRKHRPRKTRR